MGLAEGNIYVNEIKELLKLKEDIDTHDEEFHNKKKKTIDDYFNKQKAGTDADLIEDRYTHTLESKEERCRAFYNSDTGTLNDRILEGFKAGELWDNRMRHIDKSTRLEATEMTTNGTEPALPLQSDNGKRLFIGADAVALYPSLDRVATARIAGNSVRTTRTKFGGINYVFLCIYLFLIMGT